MMFQELTLSSVGTWAGLPKQPAFDCPAVTTTSPTPMRSTVIIASSLVSASSARSSRRYHPPAAILVTVPENAALVTVMLSARQSVATPLLVLPGITTNRASTRARLVTPEIVPLTGSLPRLRSFRCTTCHALGALKLIAARPESEKAITEQTQKKQAKILIC